MLQSGTHARCWIFQLMLAGLLEGPSRMRSQGAIRMPAQILSEAVYSASDELQREIASATS